jgi:hypothetical protein
MVLSLASEKIPSDTTGHRSRDLPTSTAVLTVMYLSLFFDTDNLYCGNISKCLLVLGISVYFFFFFLLFV